MACVNNARVSDRHLRGWRGQLAVEVMLAWVHQGCERNSRGCQSFAKLLAVVEARPRTT